MRTEKCLNCERLFETNSRGAHKYCSLTCRNEWYNKQRRAKMKEFVCANCGVTFQAIDKRRKFCTQKCAKDAQNAKVRIPIEARQRSCEYCKAIFFYTRSSKRFCSQTCVDKARRKRKGPRGLKQLPTKVRKELRKQVLREARGRCWLCKELLDDSFDVHHLDGEGYGENPDNSAANLIPLHRACHKLFHNLSLVKRGETWKIQGEILKKLDIGEILLEEKHGLR